MASKSTFSRFTTNAKDEYRPLTSVTSVSREILPGSAPAVFIWLAIHSLVYQQTICPPPSLRCQLSTNQMQRRALHGSFWSRAINVSVMSPDSCNNYRVRRYRPASSLCDRRNNSRRCSLGNIHFLSASVRRYRCVAYAGSCVPEVAIPRICIAGSPAFGTFMQN